VKIVRLLGHIDGGVTALYSHAEIAKLITLSKMVCGGSAHEMPTLTFVKRKRA